MNRPEKLCIVGATGISLSDDYDEILWESKSTVPTRYRGFESLSAKQTWK
jgi:hypothetical protein